jgi:hypothetical protein
MARGDRREVIRLHPLAPVLALELLAAWLLFGLFAAGWRLRVSRARLERFAEVAILANAGLFVIVWAGRWYFHSLPP